MEINHRSKARAKRSLSFKISISLSSELLVAISLIYMKLLNNG